MKESKASLKGQNTITIIFGLILFGIMSFSLLVFVTYYGNNIASGQSVDEIDPDSEFITDSDIIPGGDALTSNQTATFQDQGSPGFVATGTINSVMKVSNNSWIATGDWSMTVSNGIVSLFQVNMNWYNSSGTNAHTHELSNFGPVNGQQAVSLQEPSTNDIIINGVTDIGTNNQIAWNMVPTTIGINGKKIVTISLDNNKTNNHFGGQPILGVVDSFVPCSDQPGANMEVLPQCTVSTLQDFGYPSNETFGGQPYEGFLPFNDTGYTEGFPPSEDDQFDQGFPPSEDDQFDQGFPPSEDDQFDQGFPPSEDDQFDQGFPPSEDDQNNELPPSEDDQNNELPPSEDDQNNELPPSEDDQNNEELPPSEIASNCSEIEIRNITSSGFEDDPDDYHPPFDAIDGDSSTWWSNQGENSWLQIDLGDENSLCGLAVEWNKGDERKYTFEISVSEDGTDFDKVFDGTSKEGSSSAETYEFDKIKARYVMLTITETSSEEGWVSIKEINVMAGRMT
jgi:hypothetical protein